MDGSHTPRGENSMCVREPLWLAGNALKNENFFLLTNDNVNPYFIESGRGAIIGFAPSPAYGENGTPYFYSSLDRIESGG